MKRSFAVLIIGSTCLLAAGGAAPAAGPSPRVEGVLQEAARTGQPVLAVAGYADCAACRRFKQQLATQPLVTQFTLLELTMNGDGWREWKAWQGMTDTNQKSSPQVFVIRADGRTLHDGSVPKDLAGFLRGQLEQSGQPLSADQAAHFDETLAEAKRLATAGDRVEALRILAPALKVQSFAAPARASQEFREQLGAEIKTSVDEATGRVADSEEGIEAAVILVDASKSFSKSLPEVAKAASVAITMLKKKPDLRTVLQQAEQLQQADAAARQSAAKGADKYRKVVEQHAGSAAAAVAESRLAARRAE
jgi:hypothetical protein